MSYKEKYLKYKLKYNNLKNLIGGNDIFKTRIDLEIAVRKIISFIKNNNPFLLDNNVYWINSYGGLCIQNVENYNACINHGKICIGLPDVPPDEDMCKGGQKYI